MHKNTLNIFLITLSEVHACKEQLIFNFGLS